MKYEIVVTVPAETRPSNRVDVTLSPCGEGAYLRSNGKGLVYIDSYGKLTVYGRNGAAVFSRDIRTLHSGVEEQND